MNKRDLYDTFHGSETTVLYNENKLVNAEEKNIKG